mmetsp:Transcript_35136/g.117407  ORF Transcript_35136/g.117407 Transcript_35136/m.117407 type:complete len:239 (-) Transcript_35136:272-988(-)
MLPPGGGAGQWHKREPDAIQLSRNGASLLPSTQALLIAGWLLKLSSRGRWQRRFFALAGSTLFYADSEPRLAVVPKACAQAWRSCVRQLHPADAPGGARHAFALAGQEEEEPLYLSADSEADRLAWMRALSCSASAAPCDPGRLCDLLMLRQRQVDGLAAICFSPALADDDRGFGHHAAPLYDFRRGASASGQHPAHSAPGDEDRPRDNPPLDFLSRLPGGGYLLRCVHQINSQLNSL